MANYSKQEKLAWESLKADDNRLPQDLRDAVAALQDAKDEIESLVNKYKPAPKGRRWVFTYKHGAAHAMTDAGNQNKASCWD